MLFTVFFYNISAEKDLQEKKTRERTERTIAAKQKQVNNSSRFKFFIMYSIWSGNFKLIFFRKENMCGSFAV